MMTISRAIDNSYIFKKLDSFFMSLLTSLRKINVFSDSILFSLMCILGLIISKIYLIILEIKLYFIIIIISFIFSLLFFSLIEFF